MTDAPLVLARFATADGARSARARLQQNGVAATDVREVGDIDAPTSLRDADDRSLRRLERVAGRGAAVGALVGGAALLVVIAIGKDADPDVTWLFASGGGAAGGALVGAMLNVRRVQPTVEDQATRLTVTARDVGVEEVVALLEAAGATAVEVAAGQGPPS